MHRYPDLPEDLCVRARRGSLSSDERVSFDQLLDSSVTLRAAHTLGTDFDRVDVIQAGDEETIARFVNLALRARARTRPRVLIPKRVSPWILVAVVLGFTGLAFGLRATWWPSKTAAEPTVTLVPSTQASARVHVRALHRAMPSEATQAESDDASKEMGHVAPDQKTQSGTMADGTQQSRHAIIAPRTNAVPPIMLDSSERVGSVPPTVSTAQAAEPQTMATAALLLRQANSARGLGHLDEAAALYNELQRKFSASPEAHVSHVSLGKLLMARNAADSALQEFSAYLTIGGPLAEEALLGRAKALASLGRFSEERAAWETLVVRFPSSVYVAQAKERLWALSGEASR